MTILVKAFAVEREGQTLILTPQRNLAELEHSRVEPCIDNVLGLLETAPAKHVVVDLRRTGYFGTSALGLLLRLWKRVRNRQGGMAFFNVSTAALDVLRITQLDQVWPVCPSREEALRAVEA